ncbi:hypothetical protein HDU87_000724 [Geranomyces variabilis]|uniref:COP9 signalosome complex subunit 3 n=1 Tax=Geranomyces variabilis TaxID=109894 RepID=A0AAD5TQC2_9FUNG|nr:hypothetical protein HDU87_000724 [Geranomyces variabilis]
MAPPSSMTELCQAARDLSAAPPEFWRTYYVHNTKTFNDVRSGTIGFFTSALRDGSDPLSGALRPDDHSLIYLHVLLARLIAVDGTATPVHQLAANGPRLIMYAMTFMNHFNPVHACLAPEAMEALGNHLLSVAARLGKAVLAVLPLKVGCARWATAASATTVTTTTPAMDITYLTPLHAILCKAALLANTPTAALPVLDRDVTEVDPEAFGITYQDHLLYCYYGGMIYTQLKQHTRAMQFFELCVSAPGPHVSLIMIEAHRKLILASLLATGALPTLPKYTSEAPVLRAAKMYSNAYVDFAQAYASGSAARIDASYRAHEQEFRQHGNRGLARQCVEAVTRRAVQRLTDTYLTLSLQDIAKSVGLATDATPSTANTTGSNGGGANANAGGGATSGADQTERLVLRMIQDGQVFAKISSRDGGMVSFRDAPQRYTDAATTRRLDREIAQAMMLANRVLKMDRSIAVNKDFASKIASAESRGGSGGHGAGPGGIGIMVPMQMPGDYLMDADAF